MEKLFHIDILTQNEKLYSGPASSLLVPCALGYLGILANHAPLIANVLQGKITLRKDTEEPLTLTSSGEGFLEVFQNNVTLLL
ncbi:MAG: hypothetical protein V2A64_07760 [Candidatus Omnitrophota bacterium]